jgi:hypothetical protein
MADQPLDPDRLMSLRQLAQLIGKDESRLRRRAAAGRLDAELVGGSYVTTLRRLVESWETRGRRGRAPDPLPAHIYAAVRQERRAE